MFCPRPRQPPAPTPGPSPAQPVSAPGRAGQRGEAPWHGLLGGGPESTQSVPCPSSTGSPFHFGQAGQSVSPQHRRPKQVGCFLGNTKEEGGASTSRTHPKLRHTPAATPTPEPGQLPANTCFWRPVEKGSPSQCRLVPPLPCADLGWLLPPPPSVRVQVGPSPPLLSPLYLCGGLAPRAQSAVRLWPGLPSSLLFLSP